MFQSILRYVFMFVANIFFIEAVLCRIGNTFVTYRLYTDMLAHVVLSKS